MKNENENETDNVVPLRNEKGQFPKGVCGNPNGRPKVIAEARGKPVAIGDLYRKRGKSVMNVLYSIINNGDNPATVRVSAIKEWNERAYGKAQQNVQISTAPESNIDATKLSNEALAEILAAAGKR